MCVFALRVYVVCFVCFFVVCVLCVVVCVSPLITIIIHRTQYANKHNKGTNKHGASQPATPASHPSQPAQKGNLPRSPNTTLYRKTLTQSGPNIDSQKGPCIRARNPIDPQNHKNKTCGTSNGGMFLLQGSNFLFRTVTGALV